MEKEGGLKVRSLFHQLPLCPGFYQTGVSESRGFFPIRPGSVGVFQISEPKGQGLLFPSDFSPSLEGRGSWGVGGWDRQGGLWRRVLVLPSCVVPFMPLPSSWKVFRLEPCSSVCSLPEEATLLWGERGAWSGVVKAARAPSSSGLGHSPGAWGLVGMSDMERFSGLG